MEYKEYQVSLLELLYQESKLPSHSPTLEVLGIMPRNTSNKEFTTQEKSMEMKLMESSSLLSTQMPTRLLLLETLLEIHSRILVDHQSTS